MKIKLKTLLRVIFVVLTRVVLVFSFIGLSLFALYLFLDLILNA